MWWLWQPLLNLVVQVLSCLDVKKSRKQCFCLQTKISVYSLPAWLPVCTLCIKIFSIFWQKGYHSISEGSHSIPQHPCLLHGKEPNSSRRNCCPSRILFAACLPLQGFSWQLTYILYLTASFHPCLVRNESHQDFKGWVYKKNKNKKPKKQRSLSHSPHRNVNGPLSLDLLRGPKL